MPSVMRHTFAMQVTACVLCLLVYVLQFLTLDYYLAFHLGATWWCWIIADVVVGACFTLSLIISHRYLKKRSTPPGSGQTAGGELPLGYITWALYSSVLAIKLVILFGHPYYVAQKLDEADFFGPNTLKTAIALAAIVFFLFIETHNDAEPDSDRQTYLTTVTASATMDIIDTVQLLEVLFIQQSHVFLTFGMHRTILGVAFVNLVLPTVLLLIFSKTRYGRGDMPKKLKLFHKLVYTLIVNVPMLIIRVLLWNLHSANISVFVIKNVMSIGMTLKNIVYQCLLLQCKAEEEEGGDVRGEEIEMTGVQQAVRSPDKTHHPGISAEI